MNSSACGTNRTFSASRTIVKPTSFCNHFMYRTRLLRANDAFDVSCQESRWVAQTCTFITFSFTLMPVMLIMHACQSSLFSTKTQAFNRSQNSSNFTCMHTQEIATEQQQQPAVLSISTPKQTLSLHSSQRWTLPANKRSPATTGNGCPRRRHSHLIPPNWRSSR